ncbi:MAG: adenylate/guanylate cyclase domain-containing protein [Myxococcota bacterium]
MKISRKYPLLVVLTTLTTGLGVFFAMTQVMRGSVESELIKRGESISDGFALAAGALLADPTQGNVALLQTNILALGNDPDVLHARITNEEGLILASISKKEVGLKLPKFLWNPKGPSAFSDVEHSAYHFRSTVRHSGKVVGAHVVSLSRRPVDAAVRYALRNAVIFCAGIALALALIAFSFAQRLVQPISLMSEKVRAIAAGDYSQRMPEGREDELGELSSHFNSMLHRTELFLHYVDRSIVDRLATDESLSEPGGRLRDLSVVFGDMRGYTAMSNRRTADEVVNIVNAYFHLLIECIAHFGGLVDKTMGDAIMATFERDEADGFDDHVRRAVLACAYMKTSTRILNDFVRMRSAEGEAIAIEAREFGFSTATGKAIVGNIGNYRRMDYTVCGRIVNLASRIEALTKHGEVVLDNFSRIGAEDLIQYESLPPVQPKGFSDKEKVTPHRLTGLVTEEANRMRSFLKRILVFSYIRDHLMPRDLPVGQQQGWCAQAEEQLKEMVTNAPLNDVFERVDTETGRRMSPSEPRPLQISK